MNETGWYAQGQTLPPGFRGYCLPGGLADGQIMRPSQLIFIAEAMGWSGFGVAYQNGQLVDNENAPVSPAGPGTMPGWLGWWPNNSLVIPFNGESPGSHGGTVCMIYNLRVSHRGTGEHADVRRSRKGYVIVAGQELGELQPRAVEDARSRLGCFGIWVLRLPRALLAAGLDIISGFG